MLLDQLFVDQLALGLVRIPIYGEIDNDLTFV